MINISVVLYNTPINEVSRLIALVENCNKIEHLYIIDNSHMLIKKFWNSNKVKLFHRPDNPGYGAGHNIAINESIKNKIKYHLVLNTDVIFDLNIIDNLVEMMADDDNIGIITPKILNSDGTDQGLCKLLPSPIDLISRLLKVKLPGSKNLELNLTNKHKKVFAPYLSGCFMLMRSEIIERVGCFDERFFMYPEDIDLSRRVAAKHKCIMKTDTAAVHLHAAESKKSFRMLSIHIFNMIRYFNKWGWVFDKDRKKLNKKALNQFS